MVVYNKATIFEYDKVLKTHTEFSSTGTEKEFYDDRGLRLRFESYNEKGKLVGSGEAKYSPYGFKISETGSVFGIPVNDVFESNENAQPIKQHQT